MYLDSVGVREAPERDLGQGRGAVLYGSTQPIVDASDLRKLPQGLEVDGNVGDGPIRQNDAAVGGTGLDADLGNPRQVAPDYSLPVLQLRRVRGHEGVQILYGRVALSDLTDL